MAGISVDDLARLVAILERRWPGCTVGRPEGNPYHEVRTAQGELILAHEDLGEALRSAVAVAQQRLAVGLGGIGTRGGEG